ncbi:MAG: SprT-like domain-containing protein [Flavobacteriales bacterium]|nr:SprT-like domain-containing protein [Flavobacteriales bacterium]
MNREERIRNAIRPFVPEGTAEPLAAQILKYRCQLTITRDRKSKAGDYRHPWGNNGHRISVNGSLNQYAFLITFVHEMAHLVTWERHRNKVNPHGKEWKQAFKEEMTPFLNESVFPIDVLKVLVKHMKNPKSATVRDQDLVRVLRGYDEDNGHLLLDEIPEGADFLLNKRMFTKGERLRKRYRCTEKGTERVYLVSGIAEVELC